MRKGGKILFAALALFPLFFGFCFVVDDPGPLFVPAFTFFLGLMRMLYARIFEDAVPAAPAVFQSAAQSMVAPPPVSFLRDDYQPLLPQANVPTTGNLVAPASVAEPTTNLLNRS